MKIVKILSLTLSAVLLVGATIAGTVAYLTSTKTVTNTFTFGNVSITVDEAKADLYGTPANPEERVTSNEYKLIPGHTYQKDTEIQVAAGSESCYLFVEIDSNFASCTNVATILGANGWKPLDGVNGVYCYEMTVGSDKTNIVPSSQTELNIDVIPMFTVNTTVANGQIGFNSDIIAYAVQSDGFTSAAAAWNATFGATPPAQG